MSCIPPNIDNRPVFKKGGYLYWESWSEINLKCEPERSEA